jgi:ribosomal protein S4E
MNKIKFVLLALMVLISHLAASVRVQAQEITVESIQILRINEQDEKAMIKLPDGRMQILKAGDSIGKNGKVTEIVEGRIVIEERTEKGLETIIIRIEKGKQRIERIRKIGEGPPGLYSPVQSDKAK